jgi:hypothetical protein
MLSTLCLQFDDDAEVTFGVGQEAHTETVKVNLCDYVTMQTHSKEEVDAVKNGDIAIDTDVDESNRTTWARAKENYLLSVGESERKCLADGFHEVIPAAWVSVFTWKEMELLMCGVSEVSVLDWMNHTVYSGHYEPANELRARVKAFLDNLYRTQSRASSKVDHAEEDKAAKELAQAIPVPQVKWFWEAVLSFDHTDRTKLLQFSTGTASLPVEGFQGLQSKAGSSHPFHVTSVDPELQPLPRAHTCFNKIDLPIFDTSEQLKERLKFVIQLEAGFGMGE